MHSRVRQYAARAEGMRALTVREHAHATTDARARQKRRVADRAEKAAERHTTASAALRDRGSSGTTRWTTAVPVAQGATSSSGTEVERRRQERLAFVAEPRPEPPRAVRVSAAHDRVAAEKLEARDTIMDGIRETRRTAMERTICEGTHVNVDSAWRLWLIFCPIRGIDAATFGQLENDEHPRPSQLMWEDQCFADFAAFAVENPRKAGMSHLLGDTAAGYVSRVMTRYESMLQPPRRPGGAGGLAGAYNQLGHALRRTLKGLRKMYPADKKKGRKAAVTRRMMMAIKGQLDMADPYDAMVWAYCCTCWQGGRRSGELVRGKTRRGPWDPRYDMHRKRVSNELGDNGEVLRTVIALAPDKTDVTGEEGHEALLPMCREAAINAAAAIEHMLELDPTPNGADARYVPLFRNTRQGGKAMTYGAIRVVVKKLLMRAGMSQEEAGTHSFRRGCATALLHVGASDSTSRAVGVWASNAMHGYMDVTVGGDMERAMLAMAEAEVRVRPAASGRGID